MDVASPEFYARIRALRAAAPEYHDHITGLAFATALYEALFRFVSAARTNDHERLLSGADEVLAVARVRLQESLEVYELAVLHGPAALQ